MIHVIYDGGCGFCLRAVHVFRLADVGRRFSFHDGRDAVAVNTRFSELAGADFDAAMFAYAAGEAPYRGFFAVRRMVRASPLLWPLLPAFYFPLASVIGPRMYAWVARHRRSLGCDSEHCELPRPTVPPRSR